MKQHYAPLCAGLLVLACGGLLRANGNPELPFFFVKNVGQAPAGVRYIGNGPDFKGWFLDRGVTFQQAGATTHMEFAGGAPKPVIEATDPTGGVANYLRGENPAQWHTGLAMVSAIHYLEVWPGIEARFKADKGRAKAEYVVAPGASPQRIRLRFDGVASIQEDGSLQVKSESGEFVEDKPVLYQDLPGGRRQVAGAFRMISGHEIGFEAGDYDPARELVIDPSIVFSGYFGGSAQSTITAITTNSYYQTVVAGWTVATDLPANGLRTTTAGGVDAFVAAFRPDGNAMVFCTYLGGSGDDRAYGVATDAQNNIYLTGATASANFPLLNPTQNKLKGVRDAFVAKINATGTALSYSTFLGGSGVDAANGIAVSDAGLATVIGDTTSAGLGTSGGLQQSLKGTQDAFVATLSADGASLLWFTYFGGSGIEHGAAIKRDQTGALIIGGYTYSADLPAKLAFQPRKSGGQDGFVARIAGDGKSLLLSTYIGGSGGSPGAPESVNAVTVGVTGVILAAGVTSSTDFPTIGTTVQTAFGGGATDGFVARIVPATGALTAATFLGGSGDEAINGITADMSSYMYVTGYTTSTDFPTRNAAFRQGEGMDAFVSKLSFAKILFSSYLGGHAADCGNAIAIDLMTNIVVGGSTASSNFPVMNSPAAPPSGELVSFIVKLAPNFTPALANAPYVYADRWHNTGYAGPGTATLQATSFGSAGDIIIAGDWDGSGVKRLGSFRAGSWILDTNNNGVVDAGDQRVTFGQTGDVPIVGDWNGTGKIKLGLFRQGAFILDLSGHLAGLPTGLADATFTFGLSGDIPVVGDWNSSGTDKVGVFRAGSWLVDYNGDRAFNSADRTYVYGQAGDTPLVGDWNSSGVMNQLGIYRNGVWMLNIFNNNQVAGGGLYELYLGFGAGGYAPLVL